MTSYRTAGILIEWKLKSFRREKDKGFGVEDVFVTY